MTRLTGLLDAHAEGTVGHLSMKHASELVRLFSACSELHTVSSLIGGIASQEIIKLLTRQFVPMNNTYVLACSE